MRFDHLQARGLEIVSYRVLQRMGAETYSIAIHLDEEHDGERLVRSFLTGADFRLFTGLPGEGGGLIASVYLSIGVTGVSGLGPLMIPIGIAALIVLNTMMTATYERFREIAIYSSVGLAPMHIAALFLAEACVYGVLGALGYLLGQTGAQDSRRPRSARRDLPTTHPSPPSRRRPSSSSSFSSPPPIPPTWRRAPRSLMWSGAGSCRRRRVTCGGSPSPSP
ncbi:MAG: ABC transporter permease [Candidatus Latescibacterota bacterium]